jgi:hypothetical protein
VLYRGPASLADALVDFIQRGGGKVDWEAPAADPTGTALDHIEARMVVFPADQPAIVSVVAGIATWRTRFPHAGSVEIKGDPQHG